MLRGTPTAVAYRFPVPHGRIPTSTPDSASGPVASRTVPSPPATTTSESPRATAAADAERISAWSPDSTTRMSSHPRRTIADCAASTIRARVSASRRREASGLTMRVALGTTRLGLSGRARGLRGRRAGGTHAPIPVPHNEPPLSERPVLLRATEVRDVQRHALGLLLDDGDHLLLDHRHHDLVP